MLQESLDANRILVLVGLQNYCFWPVSYLQDVYQSVVVKAIRNEFNPINLLCDPAKETFCIKGHKEIKYQRVLRRGAIRCCANRKNTRQKFSSGADYSLDGLHVISS